MGAQLINGVFYDSDYSVAVPVGGVRTSNPFPWQSTTLIFEQDFQQWLFHPLTAAPVWQALPNSSSPQAGGMDPAVPFDNNTKTGRGPYLIGESPRRDLGGGVVEWTRAWAHVPGMIYEFPGMNYQRQKYSVAVVPLFSLTDQWGNIHTQWKSYSAIEEWGEPLTGIVHRRFVRVPEGLNPAKMLNLFKVQRAFRIVQFNDEKGKPHVFELGTMGIAEPTSITRWMGEIWEVRDVYVQPANLGKEVTVNPAVFGNLPPSGSTFYPANPVAPVTYYDPTSGLPFQGGGAI